MSEDTAPYDTDDVTAPQQPAGTVVLPPTPDYATAKRLAAMWDSGGNANYTPVKHWRGSWFEYVGGVYREVPDKRLTDRLYAFLEHCVYWQAPTETKPGAWKAWGPGKRNVSDLSHAFASAVSIHHEIEPGGWLDGRQTTPFLNVQNGILDLATGALYAHTPALFSTVQIAVAYDPAAPAPTRWLAFLDAIFAGDREAIATIQQWFGYVLSGRADLQKALFILGRPRSGKGTIGTLLEALAGEANVAAPTASNFASNFGLSSLIGKTLAVTGDLRMKAGGQEAFVERVLSITGQDAITLDRKNRELWTGRLPTRLMFLSNDPPAVVDASGALASRFILVETRGSWLGREDLNLKRDLLAELPGILGWALTGYLHVAAGGRIVEPASSAALRQDVNALGSGEAAFLADCCDTGDDALEDDTRLIYAVYKAWREVEGHQGYKAKRKFGADLRSHIEGQEPRKSNGRQYQPGVRVRDDLPDDIRRRAGQHLDVNDPCSSDPRLRVGFGTAAIGLHSVAIGQ